MMRWSGHEARSMTAHGVEGGQAGELGWGGGDEEGREGRGGAEVEGGVGDRSGR